MQQGLSLVVPLQNCRASWADPSERWSISTGRFSTDTGAAFMLLSAAAVALFTPGACQRVKDDWRYLILRLSPSAGWSPGSFGRGLLGVNIIRHSGSFWGILWRGNVGLFFRIVVQIVVICRHCVFAGWHCPTRSDRLRLGDSFQCRRPLRGFPSRCSCQGWGQSCSPVALQTEAAPTWQQGWGRKPFYWTSLLLRHVAAPVPLRYLPLLWSPIAYLWPPASSSSPSAYSAFEWLSAPTPSCWQHFS